MLRDFTAVTLDRRARADLAAQAWADVWRLSDLQLSPLGLRAIVALSPSSGLIVVDVGCGAGQSVLQLAERVGLHGHVIGIDIARPLLDIARHRAGELPNVNFLETDAQTVDLADQSADAIFSRFGVMAFGNPVAAFSNFRRILKSSGKLAFVCWRALDENELDQFPLQATGLSSMVDSTPFSFAEAASAREALAAAGFEDIALQAHDEPVSSGSLDAMARVLMTVGPLGKILRENPALRSGAEPRLRTALAGREREGAIHLRAATWIVTASAGTGAPRLAAP